MNKSSIFSLLLTVIVVVVVAEVLSNDYGNEADLQANVAGSGDIGALQDQVVDGEPIGGNEIQFNVDDFGVAVATDDEQQQENSPVETSQDTVITFGMVQLAGFENFTLQRVPFNGIMFERVDMRDFKSVPVVQQNLLQDNRNKIAEFYELHAESSLLANEVYLLLQEKSEGIMGGSVNETNDFGEKSFYINYGDSPDNAFLVVKMGASVYALTYEKRLHTNVVNLIGNLTP